MPNRLHSLLILLFVVLLPAIVPALAQAAPRCFPETSFCIDGPIRAFWERNGGLPVFGFPIAPQREELVEGKPVQVQWFERNRLELHPENAPPYGVLLGRLGADRLAQQGRDWFGFAKTQPQNGCRFFAETGHNICGNILRAWRASGLELDGRRGTSEPESLALFGLPLSDAQEEDTPNGRFTVQWFERARFELHPENAPPADVLLGLLGREIGAGAPASGGPAASSCAPVEPPVSAAIRPSTCAKAGDVLTIDAFGFQSHEAISFWLTAPDGSVQRSDRAESSGDGTLANVSVDTAGLYSGAWYWVFQGVSSNHQAVVHFAVYGSSLPAGPPVIADPTIAWDKPGSVSPRSERAIFPWVVVDGANKTHIVYSTDDGNLVYINNMSGGFGEPQVIERNIGANREPFYALALGPNNTLHLAYALLGGDHQIYYRQASLSGATASWSQAQRIADGSKPFAAHLAVDGNNTAHLVWIDLNCGVYNVFYRARYADGNLSEISKPLGDCVYQNRPQVAVTGDGKIHVVFQHDRDIFYARLENGAWSAANLSNRPRSRSYNPTIATDGAELYVAWEEGVNNHDVLFRRSANGGASWSETQGFSDSDSFATFPNLAYAPSARRVYAVWSDVKNFHNKNPYVVFSAYDPQTDTHSKPQRLSTQDGASILPVVGAGPGVVSVVWQDRSRPDWRVYHIGGMIGAGSAK
jgi:hypothetical protein